MISSHSRLVFTFTIYHTLSLKNNHLIRSERNITDTVERGGYHQICCTPQRTVLKYWFLFFQCRCVYFWVATGILKAESVDKKFWNRWFTDEGIRRLCRQTRKARDHHTGGEITTSWKPGLYYYWCWSTLTNDQRQMLLGRHGKSLLLLLPKKMSSSPLHDVLCIKNCFCWWKTTLEGVRRGIKMQSIVLRLLSPIGDVDGFCYIFFPDLNIGDKHLVSYSTEHL